MHVGWRDDSLMITLPKQHKSDQGGANVTPKHVFANPCDPALCAITALGLHVVCTAYKGRTSNQLLFQGAFASRYSKFLQEYLKEASPLDLEADPRDLGIVFFKRPI